MNRAEAVEDLKRVYAVLKEDVREARAATLANPTEFNKRTLVRTCAALVEGFSYQVRQVTLATLQNTDLLTAGDLAVLRETKYQLSGQGEAEERDNRQSTLAMVLFTLRSYAKNHGAAYAPITGDNGWNCLRKAFQLRDRLMHPKSLQDLSVTDDVGADFAAGIKWWDDSVGDLLAARDVADTALHA
jgi:hypothetical protein